MSYPFDRTRFGHYALHECCRLEPCDGIPPTGERIAPVVPVVAISRKTGCKLYNRYQICGIEGLTDRSRRPYRHANRLPVRIEKLILQLKEKHLSWGAQKIRDKIKLLHSAIQLPAISTVLPELRRRIVSYRYGTNKGCVTSHVTTCAERDHLQPIPESYP
jgi:hypothetical protein